MAQIKTALARKKAVDRVIKILRAKFEEELTAIAAEAEGGDQLYLPVPRDEGYFRAPPDDIDTMLPANHDVAIYVYASTPRQLISRGSAGVTRKNEQRQMQVEVVCVCKKAPSEDVTIDGHALTATERLWVRSDLYSGAIVETVEAWSCDGESIHFISMVDDQAALFFSGKRKVIGIGSATFEITQSTSAPLRRKLAED